MDKKRIVVTGINGFVGHHLARKLSQEGINVIGVGQDPAVSDSLKDVTTEYYSTNLAEAWPEITNVDAIIHLAGLAAVGPSYDDPQRYINTNSAMITHMGEYYLKQEKKPRIVVISSGAVYDSNQPMPISEEAAVGFSSPYAVSKILVENQCAYYKNRGVECVVMRPFNHIGPGQNNGFILPDFYDRLAEAAPDATIKVGNVNTTRDYTDVRDIVEAYVKVATAPSLKHSLYNVCSGKSTSGKEILEKLKQATGKPDVQFEVDPALVRPTDIMEIYGDSSRLQQEFGWHPTYSLDQTIGDFVASKQA